MTGQHPHEGSHSAALLNIGSTAFAVTGHSISFIQEYDQAYQQFLSPDSKTDRKTVSIRLLPRDGQPDPRLLTKIFDTGQSWSMYADAHNKYIKFQPVNRSETEWLAKINADLLHVDIYCSNASHSNKDSGNLTNPMCYPLDQILLITILVGKGLLLHGAGIVKDGRGYLFAGPSGAGKSTICRLFQEERDLKILSDDRIVVQKNGQDFFMYGTPWPGEAKIAVNDSAGLHSIFFLRHSSENMIKELRACDALPGLFKVASLPWYDKTDLPKSLDFCEELLKKVKAYELCFRPGPEIVEEILSCIGS